MTYLYKHFFYVLANTVVILVYYSTQQILADDQATWIKQTTDKIYQALKETPPDGDKFAKVIEVCFVNPSIDTNTEVFYGVKTCK